MFNDEGESHFYRDDGSEINPELVSKPNLCVTCKKNIDPDEEILCILIREDQEHETEFICHAFEPVKKY